MNRKEVKRLMKQLTKIGFIGSYKIDTIHYLTRIIHNLGKEVLAIDSTEEQLMKYTLPNAPEDDFITYRDIDFYMNLNNKKKYKDIKFDDEKIYLIDFGFNNDLTDNLNECDLIIVITDFQYHNIKRLQGIIKNSKIKDVVIVYKDIVDTKIDTNYIDFLLEIEKFATLIVSKYEIVLNESDIECKIINQYDNFFKFKDISKQYKEMFIDILTEYSVDNRRNIIKAIKKAEKGK